VTPKDDVVVVRGAPDDDELAALVAALALLGPRPHEVPAARKAPAWVRDSFTAPGSWSR
jgi:acyl-CoA carboxylase epsilon subunit-like protein